MNRRWIVLLAWLLGQGLFAGPAYDARFLNVDISYRLDRDGSWVMDYAHRVRLETGYAVNRALGESFIVYNPAYQNLRILKAETTMAVGKIVVSPSNAFNEVLPSSAHGFADDSRLREMVVTHTGLERGAVIDLHYQVLTRPGFFPSFSGKEILGKTFPVDRFRLRIVYPEGRKMNAQVLNLDAQPVITAENGEETLSLELKNLPPLPAEAGFSENDLPLLYFSTASGWDEALPGSGSSPLPAPLRDRMERIRTENPGTLNTLLALQKMVAVDIDTSPVDPALSGLHPRDCETVYLSNYGTPLEKSLLLYALLKNLQLAPELLAVMGGKNVAEKVPTAFQVSRYLVKANLRGRQDVYLDPAALQSEFYPYKSEGFPAYNIDRRTFESLPVRGAADNRIDISGHLAMTGGQIKGTLSASWKGYANQFRAAVDNPKKWIAGALGKVLPLEDVSIRKTLLLEPGETSVELDVAAKWLQPLAPGFWGIPPFSVPLAVPEWIQTGERDLPLFLDVPFSFALRLDVALENSFVPAGSAADLRLENALGSFSRVIRFTSDSHLEIAMALVVGKRVISVREYPQLRELLKNCFRSEYLLLLKKQTSD